jgi:hypothetical protein
MRGGVSALGLAARTGARTLPATQATPSLSMERCSNA